MNPPSKTLSLREMYSPVTLAVILIGNLFPIYGVLYMDWSLYNIIILYWTENVLLGIVTVFRLLWAGIALKVASLKNTIFFTLFFMFHYGVFCIVHGAFVVGLFHKNSTMAGGSGKGSWADLILPGFYPALAGIIFTLTLSAIRQIKSDCRHRTPLNEIMVSPYGRIVVLHIAVLLGSFVIMALGSPLWGLVFLVAMKILYELLAIAVKKGIEQEQEQEKEQEKEHDENSVEDAGKEYL